MWNILITYCVVLACNGFKLCVRFCSFTTINVEIWFLEMCVTILTGKKIWEYFKIMLKKTAIDPIAVHSISTLHNTQISSQFHKYYLSN
jgi:hypothetical protein